MAYQIPVAAWVFDHAAAAAVIGEPADYFDDYRNDRYDGLERLAQATGLPVDRFATEDESVYYIGIHVDEEWRIDLDQELVRKAAAVLRQHPHPLMESARLAVVSGFR